MLSHLAKPHVEQHHSPQSLNLQAELLQDIFQVPIQGRACSSHSIDELMFACGTDVSGIYAWDSHMYDTLGRPLVEQSCHLLGCALCGGILPSG